METPQTTVIFVRHAQSLHPYSDDRTRPLTAAGLNDRHIVLDMLKDRHIDAFLSSPYTRSVDTVRPAADFFGIKIITDERFRERKAGLGSSQLLTKRWADHTFAEPGGESIASAQERNMEALRDVLEDYAGKTVVIGTHGTALSTILNHYDPSFGADDFLRIMCWMPYIIELTFDGGALTGKRELAYIKRPYQTIDFSRITACGECCDQCPKKLSGACPGCIEADGRVPEWAESGQCRIHACVKAHGALFCGLCRGFPCDKMPVLIHWDRDAGTRLTYLRDEYFRQSFEEDRPFDPTLDKR